MLTDNTNNRQVALVTGAAQRIGASIARQLHHHDMNVIIHYRSSRKHAEALVRELNQKRANSATALAADLLQTSTLPQLISDAHQHWGRLDALINNASGFYPTPIETTNEQQWDELLGSNLKAPFFLAQAAAPHLKKTQGCIINIIDIHAQKPLKGHPIYSVAKAGLQMLTLALARELGPEIRVNGVSPGAILWPETELSSEAKIDIIERTALKRQGCAEDIATTVAFMVRDAKYISGQILSVDGGRTLTH